MADTIEVYPGRGGGWRWRHEGSTTPSQEFDTRTEAIEDALVERTDQSVVLLKRDGTVHGELYHASGAGQQSRADLLAAASRDEAGDL